MVLLMLLFNLYAKEPRFLHAEDYDSHGRPTTVPYQDPVVDSKGRISDKPVKEESVDSRGLPSDRPMAELTPTDSSGRMTDDPNHHPKNAHQLPRIKRRPSSGGPRD